MSVFGAYSHYYNLFYKDKDYAGEVRYVRVRIRKYRPDAKTILNLGCGTGRQDFELNSRGYEIVGVDMSENMLAAVEARPFPTGPRISASVKRIFAASGLTELSMSSYPSSMS